MLKHTLEIRQFQQMLNSIVNFLFYIMKKILDLAHDNLLDILGGHGIGINIHGCPRNGHLCTKISSKTIAMVMHRVRKYGIY